MEDITNVVDDGGTEELLARLSHHVSSQLNVPPPQPDPHGDLLLRTMLYGDLLDGAGERVGEEVVGPSARREADEAAVLRSALTDGAERMLAEHAQTVCAYPPAHCAVCHPRREGRQALDRRRGRHCPLSYCSPFSHRSRGLLPPPQPSTPPLTRRLANLARCRQRYRTEITKSSGESYPFTFGLTGEGVGRSFETWAT